MGFQIGARDDEQLAAAIASHLTLLIGPGGPVERVLGPLLPIGGQLEKESGIALIEQAMDGLTDALRQALNGQDGLQVLLVIRTLARYQRAYMVADGLDRLAVAELAALKFASWRTAHPNPVRLRLPIPAPDRFATAAAVVLGDALYVMGAWRRRLAKGQVARGSLPRAAQLQSRQRGR